MNVLLISPNTLTVPYPVYPLGLDYVAGAIPSGHEVRIVDQNVTSLEELAHILDQFRPDIIGLACRNIDNTDAGAPLFLLESYRQMVQWLRQRCQAVLVCGGSGFTIMPEQVLAMLGADYGIIGEGERFGLLVETLAQGHNPATLPGVLSAGEKAITPLPWTGPMARAFPEKATHHRFYLENGGMLNLQSKRGCSFRCLYCPYPSIEGNRHRLIAPKEVAATALQLKELGAKYLFITDSAFNSDVEHSLAVARALRAARLDIPWGAFFSPVRLPPDYFTVMAEAGLRHVEFGTESLAASMLKTYRKPFLVTDVLKAHELAQKARLHVAHYFLFGGPGESRETVNESLEAIERLTRSVFFFFTGIRIYPGTPLYETAVAEGKINRTQSLLKPFFYEPDAIARAAIESMIAARAAGRKNWITGSGGEATANTVYSLYQRGFAGPLWEYLAA